jgi:sugar lactone lactonase YvrE
VDSLLRRDGGLRRLLLTSTALAALAGLLTAQAEPPRGGDLIVVDRSSQLGSTPGALFTVDTQLGLIRPFHYPELVGAPHGLSWGPGKTVYLGDGSRLLAIDTYLPPNAPARVIQHRFLFAVGDLVRTSDNRVFVLDQFGDPLEEGYSGAVVELDPVTEDVSIVASDPRFVSPSSIAAEEGGTLLVLDPWGRMVEGGAPTGAVYRVDPADHSVTAILSLEFMAPGTRPMAIALRNPQTLLLVDADASLPNHPPLSGLVYVISLVSYQPVGVLIDDDFRSPIDVVTLPGDRLAVIDSEADPLGFPEGRGAIFIFDLRTNARIQTITRSFMRDLGSAALFDSPDLDGSRFRLTDLNRGELRPGDLMRFEAHLANTGPVGAGDVLLTADVDSLLCLLGTARTDAGEVAFDDAASQLRWSTTVGGADTVSLEIDLRVPDTATMNNAVSLAVRLASQNVDFEREFRDTVRTGIPPGTAVYVDSDPTRFPAPRLFTIAADGWTPETLVADPFGLLPYPVDLAFGLDGLIYVLDATVGAPSVVAFDPVTYELRRVHQGAPLTRPSGLCLAHDGALLIADPRTFDPINQPGAVYRFDPVSGAMTLFYSESNPDLLRDPVDICPDRLGHYLVTDYQSKVTGPPAGALFEIDGSGRRVATYATSAILTDPFSSVVDTDGSVFVTDIAASAPSVIRIRRPEGGSPAYERIAGPSDTMLVQPVGIDRLEDGRFTICDWGNNPNGPNLGALTLLEPNDVGGWKLKYETYNVELRLPRRAAVYSLPEPACAELKLQPVLPGRLTPGDTLDVRARLENRSAVPALAVGAVLSYPPALHPLSHSASRGTTTLNEGFGTVHWNGDLGYLDPDTMSVRFVVDSLAAQGEVVEIAVDMLGGLEGPRVAASDTVSAPLRGGEWVVLDRQAHPFGAAMRGACFTLDPEAGRLEPYLSHPQWVSPSDVHVVTPRRFLIVDSQADPLGLGGFTGAVFELDPETGQLSVFSAGPEYNQPQRILPDPRGGWLVLDAMAPACPAPAFGAVYHVPEEGGSPELVACSQLFRKLLDMAFDDQGRLWVSDPYANPLGFPTAAGALFAIDLDSGSVVATYSAPELRDPTGLLWIDGLGLLFTDPASRDPFGNGLIRRYDPATGGVATVIASPYLDTPTRLASDGAGGIWIADSTAVPPGAVDPGTVCHADLSTQQMTNFYRNPRTRRLQALSRVPAPRARIARFAAEEDPGGLWHAAGDSVHCGILLVNDSPAAEPWATLDVTLGTIVGLDPATLRASAGAVDPTPSGFRWLGALAGGDSVSLSYAAQLRLTPGIPPWAEHRAALAVAWGGPDSAWLRHYVSNVTASGELVVADSRARPLDLPKGSGAIFRVEGPARLPVPILADTAFVSPVAVRGVPGVPTDFLVVDGDARPLGTGSGGALFRSSTTTGETRLVFAHPSMVEPAAVVAVDSETAYVLDSKADPFDLIPGPGDTGPGAIYRVNLLTGEGEVLVSDTLLVEPSDLVLEPTTGELWVIDRRAGGASETARGGAFKVDPVSRTIRKVWAGIPFRSPRCGVIGPDGVLLLIDARDAGGSAVYSVTEAAGPTLWTTCLESETPSDVLLEPEGTLLMADATAHPEGLPENTGSILRLARTGDRCRLYRSGAPLVRPSGVTARYEQTPAANLDVRLAPGASGVTLSWTVPLEDAGALYFVYRRDARDPDREYALLNPYSPVQGPGAVRYLDADLPGSGTYEYVIVGVFPDGSRREYGPFAVGYERTALAFFLQAPSPNPWRVKLGSGALTLRFGVPRRGMAAHLVMLDVTGRCVRELWNGPCEEAVNTVAWDGRDASGGTVASGIYFLRLQAERQTARARVILLR